MIHTLILLVSMYGGKSWTVKKVNRKRVIHVKYGFEESSTTILEQQKTNKWALKQIKPEDKSDRTEAVLLQAHHEKAVIF